MSKKSLVSPEEPIFVLAIMHNSKLVQTSAFRSIKAAQIHMIGHCTFTQKDLIEQGIADAEYLFLSKTSLILQWNGGKESMTFDVLKSTLR